MEVIEWTVSGTLSRSEIRRRVVEKFLEESPGKGKGDLASKYRYNVEKLSDGRWVYLSRPAYLKKGFDFRINVEKEKFSTGREYPKHSDIFDDLVAKKADGPKDFFVAA